MPRPVSDNAEVCLRWEKAYTLLLAILISKPRPYKVNILCRGPKYESIIRDSMNMSHTGVLGFDDVVTHIV